MDILLTNLNSEQADAIQRLAKLMNIGVQVQRDKEAQMDAALMRAMQEAKPEGVLSSDEKAAFLKRLSQK